MNKTVSFKINKYWNKIYKIKSEILKEFLDRQTDNVLAVKSEILKENFV